MVTRAGAPAYCMARKEPRLTLGTRSVFVTDDEQEECREQLCNCGALPALIQLASMDDEATRLRCVVAFANLSCEYTIRGQMVRGRAL